MKNPFELIREIEYNNLETSRKNFQTNISNIESFIIWIDSFAITGIGLMISNLEKLKLAISYENVKCVLVFFVCTLIFGIFNRYSIFRFLILSQRIENYVKLSLSNSDFPEINPNKLPNDINFSELIDKFKLDYDLDYSNHFEVYEKLNSTEKIKAINDLKARYYEVGEFLHKTYNEGLENVRNIYKEAYGISESKSRKIFYMKQSKISKNFNLWKCFVDLSFIFSCLSFIIAILILVIGTFYN